MSGRLRILLIVAVVIVILGAGAAFILPGLLNNTGTAGGTGASPDTTNVAQQPAGATAAATPVPAATPIPTVDIIVAVQQINRGQLISPDLIDFRTWPALYAPQSAITNIEDVIGKIARVDIFREQPILRSLITESLSELGAVGSDAGALLPQGRRLIAVPMDRFTGVAGALAAGDRVDLIASFLFVDLDPEFQSRSPNAFSLVSVEVDEFGSRTITIPPANIIGRVENRTFPPPIGTWATILGAQEYQRPRLTTQMTVQDALVIGIGIFPAGGRIFGEPTPLPITAADAEATAAPTPAGGAADARRVDGEAAPPPVPEFPDIIALAVSPQEAVVLTYFIESRIPMTMVLRPANEIGLSNVAAVNLEYIMSQYRISLPRRLDYGLEPAIRSIRQILTSGTIQLRDTETPLNR